MNHLLDLLVQELLGSLLHLRQDHRGELLRGLDVACQNNSTSRARNATHESLPLAAVVDLDRWPAVRCRDDLERPVLHVILDLLVREFTTNQTLETEDGVRRVDDGLTLRGETDETFAVLRESDNRGGRARTLGVLNHTRRLALHHGHTRVGRPKVNADDRA